ncbi:unnamed protein product [Fraxinus pennsylvanica]|uniref:APO domain-containing protein n=1 Tax=Fraxinus pennsylvanica TaxID=56036 RepID=A0AAD1ZDI7_9LAMI|nr:unnamed protein product [Fraxinus pennsylvanica]
MVNDNSEVKRKARLVTKDREVVTEVNLRPPENGLLVKELITVAHEVLAARSPSPLNHLPISHTKYVPNAAESGKPSCWLLPCGSECELRVANYELSLCDCDCWCVRCDR